MVCVCVCNFRSQRSFKPSFATFQMILFLSLANFLFYWEKYSKYDDHFCYKVAVWPEKYGQRQAGMKHAIPESTVRGFFKFYCAQNSLAVKTKALKQGKGGKRTMLPAEIDEKVLEMIRNMRNAEAVINFHIVVGLATGIVLLF